MIDDIKNIQIKINNNEYQYFLICSQYFNFFKQFFTNCKKKINEYGLIS